MAHRATQDRPAQPAANAADTVRDEAGQMARQAGDKLRETAREQAEAVRERATDEVRRAAHAAEAAADEFDPRSLQAQATGHVADQLEDLAQRVRHTDIDRLARNISGFARDNPLLFAGAGAVLGFAVTRFLRAERPAPRRPQPRNEDMGAQSDPWTGPAGTDAAGQRK